MFKCKAWTLFWFLITAGTGFCQITFIAPRNMCWGSQAFLFPLTFMFPPVSLSHISWNRTCSVIWNALSDNVINRAETCLKMPWDLYLIFIKGVITLGAARLSSLSIFINCISQLHWVEKSYCFMSFLIFPICNVLDSEWGKKVIHNSNSCLSHTIKF